MDFQIDYESKLKEIIIDRLERFWTLSGDELEIISVDKENPLNLFEEQLDVEDFRSKDAIAGTLVESLSRSLGNFVEESFSNLYDYRRKFGEKIRRNISLTIPGLVKLFRDKLKGEKIDEESFEKSRRTIIKFFKDEGDEFYRHVKESYENLIKKIVEKSNKLRGYLCIYELLHILKKSWGDWISFENISIGNEKTIQELFCDLIGNNISFASMVDSVDPFNLPDISSELEKEFWSWFRERYINDPKCALEKLISKICSSSHLENRGDMLYDYISQFFELIEKLNNGEFLSSEFLEDAFNQFIVQHGILEYEVFRRVVEMKYPCIPKVAFFEVEREKRKIGEIDLLMLKDQIYLGVEVTTRINLKRKEGVLNNIKELVRKKNLDFEIKIIKSKEELEKLPSLFE